MATRDLTILTGVLLDENLELSLRELCHACHVNAERIIDMVEEGIIDPHGVTPPEWRFNGVAVRRVQIVLRLQQDLRVNLAGAALVLDLLEEVEELRRLHSWRVYR